VLPAAFARLALLTLVVTAAVPPAGAATPDVDHALAEAGRLVDRGEYMPALDSLDRIERGGHRSEHQQARLHHLRALAQANLGRHDDAVRSADLGEATHGR